MINKIESAGFNPESNQEYLEIGNNVYEAVEKSSLEDGEFVEIGEMSFYVMYFDDLEQDDPQAWYSWNSSVADVDIYIYSKLADSEKKRSMFHEILECAMYDDLAESDKTDSEESLKGKSHNLALIQEEERYGKRSEGFKID